MNISQVSVVPDNACTADVNQEIELFQLKLIVAREQRAAREAIQSAEEAKQNTLKLKSLIEAIEIRPKNF